MTDAEIIKALKEILEIMLVMGDLQKSSTISKAIDLINRLQEEKAEQQSEIKILKDSNKNLQELYCAEREKVKKAKQKVIDIAKALQTAKAEAYKEFAKKVYDKRQFTVEGECVICEDDFFKAFEELGGKACDVMDCY